MAVISGSAAMHAGTGNIAVIRVRKRLSVCQFVNMHPGDAVQFVGFILFKRHIILSRCAIVQLQGSADESA